MWRSRRLHVQGNHATRTQVQSPDTSYYLFTVLVMQDAGHCSRKTSSEFVYSYKSAGMCSISSRYFLYLFLNLNSTKVEQLKSDNIVNPSPPQNEMGTEYFPFETLIEKYATPDKKTSLTSVHEILPRYLS